MIGKTKFSVLLLLAILIISGVADADAQGRPRPVYGQRNNRTSYQPSTGTNSESTYYGYKGFIETGYAAGVGIHRANQLDILTTHGMTFGNNLFIGVGFGVNLLYPNENGDVFAHRPGGASTDKFHYNNEKAVMIPLYGDIKYNFGNSAVRPFIEIKAGAAFLANSHAVSICDGWIDDKEGLYFCPTIGLNIPMSRRAAINIGLSYNLMSQKYYYYDFYYDRFYSNDGISLHSLGVKFSIEW